MSTPSGAATAPRFDSAGPHWNPAGASTALNNPAGPHAGDLPNVTVAANGVLDETVSLPGASFASLLDADGAALVIHADRDDYAPTRAATAASGSPAQSSGAPSCSRSAFAMSRRRH